MNRPPAQKLRYTFAAQTIQLDFENEEQARALQHSWETVFCLKSCPTFVQSSIFLKFQERLPPEAHALRSFLDPNVSYLRLAKQKEKVLVELRASEAFIDLKTKTAYVNLNATFFRQGYGVQRDFLTVILLELLRTVDYFGVHGNALIHPKSKQAFLILGASGVGKTTLSLSLILEGWQFLPDDILLMKAVAGRNQFWGLRRGYGVTQESKQKLTDLEGTNILFEIPTRQKFVLDMAAKMPEQTKESFVPDVLLFPELSFKIETQTTKLSKREALLKFFEQSPGIALNDDYVQEHSSLLASLVKTLAAYRLELGTDVLSSAKGVAEKLSNLGKA